MARKKTPPEYGESPWKIVSHAVAVFVVEVATPALLHRQQLGQGIEDLRDP
jgi:hypothetical protein